MANWGPWQILLVVLVVVVLFGGRKLPELARSLGKAKNEFKKGLEEGAEDDEAESKKSKAKALQDKDGEDDAK